MDIGNISAYMDYTKTQASSGTASKVQEATEKDYSNANEEELLGACKQFESYLLEQVFKEMMKTTSFVDKESSYGNLVDYFGDNVIQEISKQSTETQGLGLAEQLYEQMKRNYQL